ncbi:MAG: hypothetical protein AB1592_03475 [Pseudomonadota bacterium]
MSRSTTVMMGAIVLVLAVGAAVMFSGRGTPEMTETAPNNVPASPAAPATPANPGSPTTPVTPAQ